MPVRIAFAESEYADITVTINGKVCPTLSLEEMEALRDRLWRNYPPAPMSGGTQIRAIWRAVKASQYRKKLRIQENIEGDDWHVLVRLPGKVEATPTIRGFVRELPSSDKERAIEYFEHRKTHYLLGTTNSMP